MNLRKSWIILFVLLLPFFGAFGEVQKSPLDLDTLADEALDLTPLKDEEIDVALIATPNWLHKEQAVRAFEAGKHVFLEKPIGVNLEECDAVLDAWSGSGRLLRLELQGETSTCYEAPPLRLFFNRYIQ